MILFLPLIFSFAVGASTGPKDKALADFFKEKTKIDNPLELRDPFKAPVIKGGSTSSEKKSWSMGEKGVYSNIASNNFSSINIQEMKVVGVLIGKERRALIKASDAAKEVLIIKEGMKIGPDEAELKAILPGGVVLVEKIVNVYGQDEYLETVIPISR